MSGELVRTRVAIRVTLRTAAQWRSYAGDVGRRYRNSGYAMRCQIAAETAQLWGVPVGVLRRDRRAACQS